MKNGKSGLYALILTATVALSLTSCRKTLHGYCSCEGEPDGQVIDESDGTVIYDTHKKICNNQNLVGGNCTWETYYK